MPPITPLAATRRRRRLRTTSTASRSNRPTTTALMTIARVVPTDSAPVRRDIVAADAVDAAARSPDSNAARDAE